jgi:hypothetical protein
LLVDQDYAHALSLLSELSGACFRVMTRKQNHTTAHQNDASNTTPLLLHKARITLQTASSSEFAETAMVQ